MKLILQIALFENTVCLQIREQVDVNIQTPGSGSSLIFKSSHNHGFRLRKSGIVEASENYLYLRGTNPGHEFDVLSRKYNSNEPRDAWLKRLKETLFEYSQSIDATYNVNDLGHTQIITLKS